MLSESFSRMSQSRKVNGESKRMAWLRLGREACGQTVERGVKTMSTSKPWRLRIGFSSGGNIILNDVNPETTYGSLRATIEAQRDESKEWVRVMVGFPPRAVDADASDPIHEFLVNGDRLLIEERDQEVISVRRPGRRRRKADLEDDELDADIYAVERREVAVDKLADSLFAAASRPLTGLDASLKGIRRDFSLALKEREEDTAATDRLASMMGMTYRFSDSSEFGHSLNGQSLGFRVQYPVGRRAVSEDHMLLPKPILESLIAHLLESEMTREGLKPHNMARRSPRVFWNLVKLKGSVVEGLKEVSPSTDFSFLESRKRTLSEKAARNLTNAEALQDIDEEIQESEAKKMREAD